MALTYDRAKGEGRESEGEMLRRWVRKCGAWVFGGHDKEDWPRAQYSSPCLIGITVACGHARDLRWTWCAEGVVWGHDSKMGLVRRPQKGGG